VETFGTAPRGIRGAVDTSEPALRAG